MSEHMENFLKSLVTRETQIKAMMRYTSMVIMKRVSSNKNCGGCGEMGALALKWWEWKTVQPFHKV